MSQLASTQPPPAAQAPPGQPPCSTSAPPGADDREPPFGAALEAELARTAPAEGQRAEQRGKSAAARRDGHDQIADEALSGAASSLVTAVAADDSHPATLASSAVTANARSGGADTTEVAGTQTPLDDQTAAGSAGGESIAPDERTGSIRPGAEPNPAATASDGEWDSARSTASDAQAVQQPTASLASASTRGDGPAAPIALDAPLSSEEALRVSPSQLAAQQQQPSSAQQVPVVALDQIAPSASGPKSTAGERAGTSTRAADAPGDKGPTTDAAPLTNSEAARAGATLAASSSGDRQPADANAETLRPQRPADDAVDATVPQALDTPTANATQGTPVSTLQTQSQGTSAQPTAGTGVALQQAVESLQATVELAARQGLAQARIQLHPAELGEIRIHLTQTSAGLLARVSAESSAAAQALISAHDELRQSLTSLGIDLAQLHVGAHEATGADVGQQGAGDQQQANAQQHAAAQTPGDRRDERTPAADGHGEQASPIDQTTDPAGAIAAVESPTGTRGALVDVLA